MDINLKVRPNIQVRAFYLLFMIFGLQVGVGIMGAPRFIFQEAQQDSWISILISLLFMLLVLMAMFVILKQYPNADIFGIQVDVFGRWLGTLLGTVYIIFFSASLLSILLTYLDVIQIFLYPTLPPFILISLILLLCIYCVIGGIRSIVGAAFLFSVLPLWLLFLLFDPISRMEWTHFLPMFQTSLPELLQGAKSTTYTVLGIEILFVFFPFIKDKKKAKLPAVFALIATTAVILLFSTISIGYFSAEELRQADWSTLTLFKSVSFPFLERLDYIVIVAWVMVIIPNITILLWAITFGIKRLYGIRQKTSLYPVVVLMLIITELVKYDHHIKGFTDKVAQVGFWIVFIYPFLLLPIVLLKKRWQKKKGRDST